MNEQDIVKELFADKRAERRWRYVRLSLMVGVASAYLFVLSNGVNLAKMKNMDPPAPRLAVVDITGEIGPGKDASIRALAPVLKNAFEDKHAKAVVLRINSPGGTPVQSSLIHDEVLRLKKSHPGLPVIAVGEDMLTSGAYLIAMSADKVVVNRSTMTGSVGVIIRSFGFTGLMEKLGVERRALTAGESKNQLDPFGPLTEDDKAKVSGMLTKVHQHFKDIVQTSRARKLKASPEELFTGAVWTGDEAVSLGLADEVGSLSTVMAQLGVEKAQVYSADVPLLEALTRSLGVSVAKTLVTETQAGAELTLR